MAVIKPYENTNSITTFLSIGWSVGLIFVLLGIKLKWFRANLNLNSQTVDNNVQTGIYRQTHNSESYSSFDNIPQTSHQPTKYINKEIPDKIPMQNRENLLEKPSSSSSNNETSLHNTHSIQHTQNHKSKPNQNLQIKSTKVKISNEPIEKSIQSTNNDEIKLSKTNLTTQNKPQQPNVSDKHILKKANKDKSKLNDKYKKEKKNKEDKKHKIKNTSGKPSPLNKKSSNETIHEQNKKQILKNTKTTEIKNERIYETPKSSSNKINIESPSNTKDLDFKAQTDSNKTIKQFSRQSTNAYSSAAASIFLGDGYDNFEDHESPTLPNTSQQILIGGFKNFEETDSLTSNTSA